MADLSKYYEKADKHLQRGKPEAALDAYLAALEEDASDERAREGAAELCILLNQNNRAAEFMSSLFHDYVVEGNLTKASLTLRKLSKVGLPVVEDALAYGNTVEKTNKREAIDAFDAALKAAQKSNRPSEAIKAMQRIVAADPKPETYRKLGELASAAGDNQTASGAYVHLGMNLEKAGFDASEAYARAYACDRSNWAACFGHGRALVAQGRAQEAVELLEPLATYPSSPYEAREPYVLAVIAANQVDKAEPYVWDVFERNPQDHTKTIGDVISALIGAHKSSQAVALARRLEDFQRKAGKRRDFVVHMKQIADSQIPDALFLEYVAEVYNSSNREGDYCETLARLFDLYYASGNYVKAADSLDRAVEVDAYEAGHQERLDRLRGKIDVHRLNALAVRLAGTSAANVTGAIMEEPEGDQPTVLEDLMLQAEIFLRYSMRARAVERLERIMKMFPLEEEKNSRLRDLYMEAGMIPSAVAAPANDSVAAPALTPKSNGGDVDSVDDLVRATEVNRNIARQSSVKGVLFAAVNDVGRNWQVSRCIAGLCGPGKPPSAALEYCAPGVKQSDVTTVVKMLTVSQAICVASGVIAAPDARNSAELAPLHAAMETQGTESLLALPLFDGDQHVGMLILEQNGVRREWKPTEIAVLRSIADQIVMAVNNARLRSLVKTLAVTDEKSGLLKRSSYLDVLLSEVRRSMQQGSPMTLLLMNFGKHSVLTRERGEPALEAMMQQIGQVLCSHVRQNDVAVRYGPTEIALLLADTNDRNAFLVVEKMRKVLAIQPSPSGKIPDFLAGIAEAMLVPEFDPVDVVTELINRAEQALTVAKTDSGSAVHCLAPALSAAGGQ